MEKTWKPTVAGILNIISGSLSLIGVLVLVFLALLWVPVSSMVETVEGITFFADFPFMGLFFFIFVGIWGALFGVLSLVGGIFSLQRRRWGWALAGSIASVISSQIIGILAIIFVSLGKQEFKN